MEQLEVIASARLDELNALSMLKQSIDIFNASSSTESRTSFHTAGQQENDQEKEKHPYSTLNGQKASPIRGITSILHPIYPNVELLRKQLLREIIASKKAEHIRVSQEKEIIETFYHLQTLSTSDRISFEQVSTRLMERISPGFATYPSCLQKSTQNLNGQYPQLGNENLMSNIVRLYSSFFESIRQLKQASEINRIFSNSLCNKFSFVCLLLNWLIEVTRKMLRDFIMMFKEEQSNLTGSPSLRRPVTAGAASATSDHIESTAAASSSKNETIKFMRLLAKHKRSSGAYSDAKYPTQPNNRKQTIRSAQHTTIASAAPSSNGTSVRELTNQFCQYYCAGTNAARTSWIDQPKESREQLLVNQNQRIFKIIHGLPCSFTYTSTPTNNSSNSITATTSSFSHSNNNNISSDLNSNTQFGITTLSAFHQPPATVASIASKYQSINMIRSSVSSNSAGSASVVSNNPISTTQPQTCQLLSSAAFTQVQKDFITNLQPQLLTEYKVNAEILADLDFSYISTTVRTTKRLSTTQSFTTSTSNYSNNNSSTKRPNWIEANYIDLLRMQLVKNSYIRSTIMSYHASLTQKQSKVSQESLQSKIYLDSSSNSTSATAKLRKKQSYAAGSAHVTEFLADKNMIHSTNDSTHLQQEEKEESQQFEPRESSLDTLAIVVKEKDQLTNSILLGSSAPILNQPAVTSFRSSLMISDSAFLRSSLTLLPNASHILPQTFRKEAVLAHSSSVLIGTASPPSDKQEVSLSQISKNDHIASSETKSDAMESVTDSGGSSAIDAFNSSASDSYFELPMNSWKYSLQANNRRSKRMHAKSTLKNLMYSQEAFNNRIDDHSANACQESTMNPGIPQATALAAPSMTTTATQLPSSSSSSISDHQESTGISSSASPALIQLLSTKINGRANPALPEDRIRVKGFGLRNQCFIKKQGTFHDLSLQTESLVAAAASTMSSSLATAAFGFNSQFDGKRTNSLRPKIPFAGLPHPVEASAAPISCTSSTKNIKSANIADFGFYELSNSQLSSLRRMQRTTLEKNPFICEGWKDSKIESTSATTAATTTTPTNATATATTAMPASQQSTMFNLFNRGNLSSRAGGTAKQTQIQTEPSLRRNESDGNTQSKTRSSNTKKNHNSSIGSSSRVSSSQQSHRSTSKQTREKASNTFTAGFSITFKPLAQQNAPPTATAAASSQSKANKNKLKKREYNNLSATILLPHINGEDLKLLLQ